MGELPDAKNRVIKAARPYYIDRISAQEQAAEMDALGWVVSTPVHRYIVFLIYSWCIQPCTPIGILNESCNLKTYRIFLVSYSIVRCTGWRPTGALLNRGLGDGNIKKISLKPDNETSTQVCRVRQEGLSASQELRTRGSARAAGKGGRPGRGEIEYYFLILK